MSESSGAQNESSHAHKGHARRHHAPHGSHEEHHEGAPEWLISFADMVMLMMGFFVILFALNISPDRRAPGGSAEEDAHGAPGAQSEAMLDFAIAVRDAFNNPVDMASQEPDDQPLIQRILTRAGQSESVDPGAAGRDHDVQSLHRGNYYSVCGLVSFADQSAELDEAARRAITETTQMIQGRKQVVELRGHASAWEAYRRSPQAMRLGFDRTMAVAEVLVENGIDWWRLRLVVCGDNERVTAFPADQDADRDNARVEIVLTDQVVPDPTLRDADTTRRLGAEDDEP